MPLTPLQAAVRFLDAYPNVTIYRDVVGHAETTDLFDWVWDLDLPMPAPLADVLDLVAEHVLPTGLTYLVPTALESYALTNHFN